jgi:hypothetical protein
MTNVYAISQYPYLLENYDFTGNVRIWKPPDEGFYLCYLYLFTYNIEFPYQIMFVLTRLRPLVEQKQLDLQ